MTYRELLEECAALGFENGVGDEMRFLYSARRALSLLSAEHPLLGELSFYCEAVYATEGAREIFHPAGTELSVPLTGKTYSFLVSGKGGFRAEGEPLHTFDTPALAVRGYRNSAQRMLFVGEYDYTVRCFSCFLSCPPKKESIPILGKGRSFSLREICEDFLRPDGVPRDASGEPIRDATIHGGTLTLPADYTGEVRLRYRRAPLRIRSGEENERIDVPEEAAHLLPLLTASYLWLDDEPERSEYYMTLYRTGLSALKYAGSTTLDSHYENVNNWA